MSGQDKKLMIYRHNAMKGHAAMMHAQCNGIMSSLTATPAAKATAEHIQRLAALLRVQLDERVDDHLQGRGQDL